MDKDTGPPLGLANLTVSFLKSRTFLLPATEIEPELEAMPG